MKTNPTKSQPHHKRLSRRKFVLTGGAAATAFTIVPRHVLGGPGFVAPSEKITVAYIGCGTQGLREMLAMLATPEIQIVAVCDPVKERSEEHTSELQSPCNLVCRLLLE